MPRINKTGSGKDGETRDPEMVRAFRDTWKLGINSYLSYLRDRLAVAKELLTESGSCFVQISEENVHLVRCVMDEIFGSENFVRQIAFRKTSALFFGELPRVHDILLWYSRSRDVLKYRQIYVDKDADSSWFSHAELDDGSVARVNHLPSGGASGRDLKFFSLSDLKSSGYTASCTYDFELNGRTIKSQAKSWRTHPKGMANVIAANRLYDTGRIPRFKQYHADFPVQPIDNLWDDTSAETQGNYVVQTSTKIIQRCLLMTTDPGDLVLDPTCGGGTTAFVAEQWGRRWIAMDASRVAITLTRARLMGAVFPYYLLKDSGEGAKKEAELSGKKAPPTKKEYDDNVHQGFVCERVPHITLRDIANNADIPTSTPATSRLWTACAKNSTPP